MKKLRFLLLALPLTVLTAAAACSQDMLSRGNSTEVVRPSELATHPEKFDGKHVDVLGYVVIGPENRNIFDSKQASEDRNAACLGLDGPNDMFGSFHKRYTPKLSGTFRRKLCGENDICLYWCSQSGIELDRGSKP